MRCPGDFGVLQARAIVVIIAGMPRNAGISTRTTGAAVELRLDWTRDE